MKPHPLHACCLLLLHPQAGYIGSHICLKLVNAGYDVRACVRNASDHEKVAHLRQMNNLGAGSLTLWEADLTVAGSCKSYRSCLLTGTATVAWRPA